MTTLIVLTGPPAVGKLTVGRALAARTGYRLFHNHLTVDLALSLFDFGSTGFATLRAAVWREAFETAFHEKVEGVIFTFNPEPSIDIDFLPDLLSQARRHGRALLVELQARDDILLSRIDTGSRLGGGKLVDRDLFSSLLEQGTFSMTGQPEPDLILRTDTLKADEAADRIAEALK